MICLRERPSKSLWEKTVETSARSLAESSAVLIGHENYGGNGTTTPNGPGPKESRLG